MAAYAIDTKSEGKPRFYKEICHTLRATSYKEPPLVLVIPKSINTQFKSMNDISHNTETSVTQQKSTPVNSPTSTYLSEASRARHLASQVKDSDSKTVEELCSTTLQESLKKKDHNIYYLKTLRDCFLTMVEELSKPSSPRLQNWGTTSNGKLLTARISVSPRIGRECSLSDILEDVVDDKYFLSPKMTNYLIAQMKQEEHGHKPNLVPQSESGWGTKPTPPLLSQAPSEPTRTATDFEKSNQDTPPLSQLEPEKMEADSQ